MRPSRSWQILPRFHGAQSLAVSIVRRSPRKNDMAPLIVVYSKHPLALHAIAKALGSDKGLSGHNLVLCTSDVPCLKHPGEILIVDVCSQEQWLETALGWEQAGGLVIILVPRDHSRHSKQVRSLYFGVRGIVSLSH